MKTESKHTPGPWKLRNHWICDETELVTVCMIPVYTAADCCESNSCKIGEPRNPKDAALILAVPTMYEALQRIALMPELIDAELGTDAWRAYFIAKQAIAKAEGSV